MKKAKKKKRFSLILILFLIFLFIIIFLYYFNTKKINITISESNNYNLFKLSNKKEYISDYLTFTELNNLSIVENDNINLNNIQILNTEGADLLIGNGTINPLFSFNSLKKIYPASITKIITAYIILTENNINDIVLVGDEINSIANDSSIAGINIGDKISVYDLLCGLLISSGNDAAVTLAKYNAGTVENFVSKMNSIAKKLGATSSNFVNPHGLHDPMHYTTAYDIYLFLNCLKNNSTFLEIISKSSYVAKVSNNDDNKEIIFNTTNLYFNNTYAPPNTVSIIGGKTGTTDEAGSNLVLLSKNKTGKLFFSLVFNSQTKDILYNQTSNMLRGL